MISTHCSMYCYLKIGVVVGFQFQVYMVCTVLPTFIHEVFMRLTIFGSSKKHDQFKT